MPSASAAPSESLGSRLKHCRAAGRMAVASAVDAAVAAVDVVDAGVVYYGRKRGTDRGMDRKPDDCVRIAEHLGIVERMNW